MNILWGILCIIAGVVKIALTLKYPNKGMPHYDYKGWIAGIALIALGISLIIRN